MLPTQPPKDWYEPIIVPLIMTVFGGLTYWLGWLSERSGKTAWWKWIGIVFLVIGMYSGYGYFQRMVGSSSEDVIYRNFLPSIRRYTYTHYAAFIIPLLTLIGCFVLQFIKRPKASASTEP